MNKTKSPKVKLVDLVTSETGDKVKVTKFTVSPKLAFEGKAIKIRFSVQNVGSTALKIVPWRIVNGKTIIYSGYRFNLKPSSSFDISVSWMAEKGKHFFYVDIDPQNILDEPRAKQFDNFPQGIDVTVK